VARLSPGAAPWSLFKNYKRPLRQGILSAAYGLILYPYQVKMIAPQTIRINLVARLLAHLRQSFEKILPVHVI
jgi:hypothetical protein